MANWKTKDFELTCSWQECANIKSELLVVTLAHWMSHHHVSCWDVDSVTSLSPIPLVFVSLHHHHHHHHHNLLLLLHHHHHQQQHHVLNFPNIEDRLQLRINPTPNFTAIVTGHGNIKTYLHKFKIIENPKCPCNKGDQTVDHITCSCKLQRTGEG